LAVGAILGAAITALLLVGLSTGRDGSVGSTENPFPLAVNDGQETTGPLVAAPQVSSTTVVLSSTGTGTGTGTTTSSSTVTVTSTTDSGGTTTTPPTQSTGRPSTTAPTTVHTTTRPKPTKTRDPCWLIFC
jgi:hypothetical protein